jgi:putative hemolysin
MRRSAKRPDLFPALKLAVGPALRGPLNSAFKGPLTSVLRGPANGFAAGKQEILGRIGALETRLAVGPGEIKRAQRLRYKVFYEEYAAQPDARSRLTRRDIDAFDPICDHLLVLHNAPEPLPWQPPRVVGTYRLLRQERAEQVGGFYTASEFDVAPLLARHPQLSFLELGRSCVLAEFRSRRTVELLWHGIWSYILRRRLDVMIGCASLHGTDLDKLAHQLSFLHHYAAAPPEWRVEALASRHVAMDRLPKSGVNAMAALRELPPLIRGYLRLGGFVGHGAVIDRQFDTVDVMMVLPVAGIDQRYLDHFGSGAERYAA